MSNPSGAGPTRVLRTRPSSDLPRCVRRRALRSTHRASRGGEGVPARLPPARRFDWRSGPDSVACMRLACMPVGRSERSCRLPRGETSPRPGAAPAHRQLLAHTGARRARFNIWQVAGHWATPAGHQSAGATDLAPTPDVREHGSSYTNHEGGQRKVQPNTYISGGDRQAVTRVTASPAIQGGSSAGIDR